MTKIQQFFIAIAIIAYLVMIAAPLGMIFAAAYFAIAISLVVLMVLHFLEKART